MDCVQVPVDLGAVIELLISQQAKAMATDVVRFSNQVFCFERQLSAQKLAAALDLIFAEKEFWCFRSTRRHGCGACVQAAPVRCQINPLSRCLP